MGNIYTIAEKNVAAGKKMLAVLVDPDKSSSEIRIKKLAEQCKNAGVDFVFAGGSFISSGDFRKTVQYLKKYFSVPVVIFPGSILQVSEQADALLFLSLISGRNPELLIGQHVIAAPHLKKSGLEIIPTGYMLIESGNITTAQYISASLPIPRDKKDIAAGTALAGEMLGMKLIYMDAGSGAEKKVPAEMIQAVKAQTRIPLVVGGGIKTPGEARAAWAAGADIVVVGTAFENNPSAVAAFKKRK
ncbi:MAG: geranylgeranylglyceryl/heptaprenylglyceryl phosphate synthase [Bacteroidota bacterium]